MAHRLTKGPSLEGAVASDFSALARSQAFNKKCISYHPWELHSAFSNFDYVISPLKRGMRNANLASVMALFLFQMIRDGSCLI